MTVRRCVAEENVMMTSPMVDPNAPWRSRSFHADLLEAAPVYIDLLYHWNQLDVLVTGQPTLRYIIHRYERCWLPLVRDYRENALEPPSDVQWVWHLHMLMPKLYIDYCRSLFGRIIPHRVRLSESEESLARTRTEALWKDRYPREPYELQPDVRKGSFRVVGNGTKLDILVNIAAEARDFFHQVALPHYRDANFLIRALDRYKQFLYFKRCRPHSPLYPPVDIQLMWRVHMLHPSDYHQEVYSTIGLHSVSEAGIDGRSLLSSDGGHNPEQVWRTVIGEPLFVAASRYRGSPPAASHRLRPLTRGATGSKVITSCTILFDEICVSELWSKDKKMVVEARRMGDTSFSYETIFRVEGRAGLAIRGKAGAPNSLGTVFFDSQEHRGIEFHVFGKSGGSAFGGCCSVADQHVNSLFYNPTDPFLNRSFVTRDMTQVVTKVSYTDPKVAFRCRVQASEPQPYLLSMTRDPFSPGSLPGDLMPFVRDLGPWQDAMETVVDPPDDVRGQWQVARHGMTSRHGYLAFGCQMISHEVQDMCAVLLYQNNEHLVAAAHTIGAETLASPSQLSSQCPVTFDPDRGEHAMMVHNHLGEWAVCKARWITNQTYGEGKVLVKVFFLQTNKKDDFVIRDDELQTIKFADVSIDMPTGKVTVDSRCDSVAEMVALAYCVGSLFVLCQQRVPQSRQMVETNGSLRSVKSIQSEGRLADAPEPDSQSANSSLKYGAGGYARLSAKMRNRKLTKRRKLSASFTFLLACGLQIGVALYGTRSTSRNSSLREKPRPSLSGSLRSDTGLHGDDRDGESSGSSLDISRSVQPFSDTLGASSLGVSHMGNGGGHSSHAIYGVPNWTGQPASGQLRAEGAGHSLTQPHIYYVQTPAQPPPSHGPRDTYHSAHAHHSNGARDISQSAHAQRSYGARDIIDIRL